MKANQPEYYFQKFLDEELQKEKLKHFVELVATPERSDGTHNYCRAALQVKAVELLKTLK